MTKENFRKGIFFLTYSKNKKGIEYLILKRKLHWVGWEFSKGGKEFLETDKRTIKRELKEETGLAPVKITKFNVSGRYKYNKKFPDREGFDGQTYKLYSVEVKKGKIIIDKREHSDYKWVDFKTALKKLTWPNQKKCLKIVDEYLANK